MKLNWSENEVKVFQKLNDVHKIQDYLQKTSYNPDYIIKSPRFVLAKKTAHCFEGALLAAAVLEYYGQRPHLLHFKAYNDDHHVIALYREGKNWGAISKTNTTMLGFRSALFPTVQSLAASYFDFYFNTKAEMSLLGYSGPVNMNKFNSMDWRYTDQDLTKMGLQFLKLPHHEWKTKRELDKLPKVSKRLKEACFYQANTQGLF
ncbi:MAG: hypothetical protein ACOVP4_04185 [Bacteriovoracaceae bacterium]